MSSIRVYPSTPVKKHVVKLSLCDVYSPKLWVSQTHFWPTTASQTFEASLDALQRGLARTLSELPALAGRTCITSADPRDLVVSIDEDASVALLAEDLTTDDDVPSYAELRASGFAVTGLSVAFSDPQALKSVSEGSPLMVAKLNKLKGGLALTFGVNHLLGDATTIASIERIWASHTADVSAGTAQRTHKTSQGDEITRLRLSTPTPGTIAVFEDPNWTLFPTDKSQLALPRISAATTEEAAVLQQAREEHWRTLEEAVDDPKWCMWYFSPQALVQLKKDCSAALEAGAWVSTIDAIVGLFWSRITYLKRSSRGDQEHGKLCFPINLRSRLDPPLDPSYIGNAVDILACDVSLCELEDPTPKGWAAAALAVRRTVTSWKQSRWESWLAVVKDLPPDQALCVNPLMLLDHRNIVFNDYSRSDSNILDWGKDFGRVERTRYMKPAGSMKGCATGVVLHPRLSDGGLEIATTTTAELRNLLEEDEVFKRYAKLECAFA